ncbi:3-hydroxybutyrate dehydrogenase [Pacificimonas flava]|uniref:3-hydroxybutyrate dehydrogenase n=2 Tax=Pacificimonas TaxID=1960290 RepID=A0A219B8E2_9SPHN|nr:MULTISPECIES: 3-hydroxybutyrate dehydrogenase [Pacificimonas]MBZ6379921.1 3-hydroxybutyrate dehydrogenase [Pacificimonas aurantium]OWV34444.1 3-hydroxybutyrate dehydrogenase [Pacificimonas flava]
MTISGLQGRTALITGSTSGIGAAIAEKMAAAGANVVLNGFGDAGEIEGQRSALERDHAIRAIYINKDLSSGSECRALVAEAAAQLAPPDILVNNAGIQHVAAIDEFPPEKWDAIIAINLTSAFHTIAAALPAMKDAGWGRIINIASAQGLVGSPFKSAYNAAKHGIIGMTKSVALEVARTKITVNAICPGYVRTPLVEGQVADQAKAHDMSEEEVIEKVILDAQPNKEFVEPGQLGDFAVFLCTEAGSSFTGAALPMDGGWTAR